MTPKDKPEILTKDPVQTPPLPRLSKVMSERGICSRREADDYIRQGLVYVDGVRIEELGVRISPDANIELASKAQKKQDQLATIIVNKPVGYVSAQPEDDYLPAIKLITPEAQFVKDGTSPQLISWRDLADCLEGSAVAGRLDIDSQGLLIFTQDGRVAKKIIGENSDVEKEYLVRFRGPLDSEKLSLLRFGLSLDDKPLRRAEVNQINPDQLKFVLKEGKKRQIRRMMDAVGLEITGLKRVRVGKLPLGDLPEGQWRFLTSGDQI